MLCYGTSGRAIDIRQKKHEATGAFFHPLLATLITGAARLMLAITEHQAMTAGFDWAFCDTDSMALAKPDVMPEAEFITKARQVQEWFTPLNPYAAKAPLLKIEDYNYGADKELRPLYCYAISSKRYGLFNLVGNKPILRKVSAHGLGHLKAPYDATGRMALDDVQPWQQDLWLEIVQAALEGRQPDYTKLRNFHTPAVSRYGATTPALERWFNDYNANKLYRDRVRPFNFMLAMQAQSGLKALKPVAPYHNDHTKALSLCFDRATGEKVSKHQLKTYLDVLAQYHLHPESKFFNGDYGDAGHTQRRHVSVRNVQHIGKEANKWEEQHFLGADPDAQIEYGISLEDKAHMIQISLQAIATHGVKSVAEAACISVRHVQKIDKGQSQPTDKTLIKLYTAAQVLEIENAHTQAILAKVKALVASKTITCNKLAARVDMDASNMNKTLSGKRAPTSVLIRKLASLVE